MSTTFELIKEKNAQDIIISEAGGVFHVKRIWKDSAMSSVNIRITYDLKPCFWIIPGVVINGNVQGKGIFPRPTLLKPWSFREDRCSIPSGVCVEDESKFVGVFLSPAKNEHELSSVEARQGEFIFRIPWEEKPYSYVRKFKLAGPRSAVFKPPRNSYSREIFIISGDYRNAGYKRGYKMFLRKAWEILRPHFTEVSDRDIGEHLRLRAQCVLNTMYYKKGGISGFIEMLYSPLIPTLPVLSGAFCGKALEIAFSLYRIYLNNKDAKLRKIALETADFFTRGLQKNGLYLAEYIVGNNRWYGYAVSRTRRANTRTMGESGYIFAKFYQLAKNYGDASPAWLHVPQKIGEFMISNQLPSGSFGKWWNLDGTIHEDSGTNGAYIIWMLAELYKITNDKRYLDAAERAMEFYNREFIETDSYWGDTLDADTPDKEASHAVLRAACLMYEVTGKKKYLDMAIEAAHAIASWQIIYKIPFSKKTPLGQRNYDTTGMTIVSVENQHLDIYGLAIAVDWFKLWKYTNDSYWKERALVALRSAMQLTSTDNDPLDLPKWFVGWQPEQIYHTTWTYGPAILARRGGFINVIGWVYGLGMGALLDFADEIKITPSIGEIKLASGILYRISLKLRNVLLYILPYLIPAIQI
ncbi:MAG: glycoside hydrolase family 76 protein [Candidatus Korarchaeota archaeon]